ncbi:MAG: hypothetical protein IPJ83_17805 [Saprospiraceae bacterium]|nr:hypothetical protein [Candidatus Vicinibacter proximus]
MINDQELVVVMETDNTPWQMRGSIYNWPSIVGQKFLLPELQCQAPKALIAEINKVLVESGIKIYSVYYKRKLEDYFFKLTGN